MENNIDSKSLAIEIAKILDASDKAAAKAKEVFGL